MTMKKETWAELVIIASSWGNGDEI